MLSSLKNISILLVFVIFLWHSYEDYKFKTITLWPMILSVILFLFINYKVVIIYAVFSCIYLLFQKVLKNHLGFGDVWYMVIYIYYFFQSIYVLISIMVFYAYVLYIKKRTIVVPLLPTLLLSIFINDFVIILAKNYLNNNLICI